MAIFKKRTEIDWISLIGFLIIIYGYIWAFITLFSIDTVFSLELLYPILVVLIGEAIKHRREIIKSILK